MILKLTGDEKQSIRDALKVMSRGTQLHEHAEFVAEYIGRYVISLVENRERVFKRVEQCAKCGASNPECVGSFETVEYYPLCAECKKEEK